MALLEERAPVGRRGGKVYLASFAVAQVCALARYTVLARLLGPEQLGLAVTLILTAQFFESITETGGDRFLIQDQDGDDKRVQRMVHLISLGRGLLIAAALILFAGPIAAFYKTPQLTTGFMVLALVPLLQGFLHLDMRRLQRYNDFRAEGLVMIVAEAGGLIATGLAAWIVGDFTTILYGLVTRSLLMALLSHVMAERRYPIGFAPEHARRLARFSAPLLLNGILLFIGSQGDRLLVGNMIGLTALGHYSAVLLLIFYPSTMVQRYTSGIFLPMVSAQRDDPARRDAVADRLAGQTLVLGLLMSIGFTLVAPAAIAILYGPSFAQGTLLIALIAVLQTSRFMRLWPSTDALASGRSGVIVVTNLLRVLSIPAAIVGHHLVPGLNGIAAGIIVGDVAAFVIGVLLVNRITARPPLHDLDRILLFLGVSAANIGAAALYERGDYMSMLAPAGAIVAMGALLAHREAATISEIAGMARKALRRRGAARPRFG